MLLKNKNVWKMRNLMALLVMVALMTIAQSVWAQSHMTEEQKAEAKARYMAYKEKLNLSDEQAVKVDEINKAYFAKLAELKNSDEGKRAKYRKLKDLQSDKDKKMKEVLNEDQYKQYKEFQAEMEKEIKERMKNAQEQKPTQG